MSGLAHSGGIAGAVIDGSCRDTDEARLLGSVSYTHLDVYKRQAVQSRLCGL